MGRSQEPGGMSKQPANKAKLVKLKEAYLSYSLGQLGLRLGISKVIFLNMHIFLSCKFTIYYYAHYSNT